MNSLRTFTEGYYEVIFAQINYTEHPHAPQTV